MIRTFFVCFISSALAVTLPGCKWFHPEEDELTNDLLPTEGINYQVTFSVPLPSDIESEIQSVSKLISLQERPPSSYSGLLKRAKDDEKTFEKKLHSLGYFDAKINFCINETPEGIVIDFRIKSGERYHIASLDIHTIDNPHLLKEKNINIIQDIMRIKIGDAVNLEHINEAQKKIEAYFLNQGYPFVRVHDAKGHLDYKTKTLHVIYEVKTNGLSYIQETHIKGLTNLNPEFVKNRLAWKNGEPFNQKHIDESRRKLLQSNVLASFQAKAKSLENEETLSNQKNIIMKVKVTESPPRAIGAGIRYSTSEGLGGQAFWHHNNVFGNGEHFGISFKGSKREQKAKMAYDIPDIGRPRTLLIFQGLWIREKTRAYSGKSLLAGCSYEIPFNTIFKTSFGAILDSGHFFVANSKVINAHLRGIPILLSLDTSDELLNPNQGLRAEFQVTPYWGKIGNQSRQLTRAQGHINVYIPFLKDQIGQSAFTFAAFIKGGTLISKSFYNTPPNKRFYAGGTGSVRGYGYQLIGPLNSDRVPLGGRSLTEWGGELRFRATEKIGLVAFLDAASVTMKKTPNFLNKNTLYGVGAGIRYFSPVGPLRFDLAFPTKRRHDKNGKVIDSPFQFYISIGQAF